MSTLNSTARQYSDYMDLFSTGKVGDFVRIVADSMLSTDSIIEIRAVAGGREITIEQRMTDHHKGVYRCRIERMTEIRPTRGGRLVRPEGLVSATQTEPEPLDQDRLRQLHTELLAR